MITLTKLHLENYRKLKSIDVDFGGKSGSIVGENRIGKTTVIEAIHFLLTGKLFGNSADVQAIKSKEDPRARVVVEGTFYTPDGEVVLRKEFYEKWVRPRGSAEEELQGHTTDFYVNGAKQSKISDYQDLVASKFGTPVQFGNLDVYQLAVNPFYLPEIICESKDWKFARRAIIEIVGDVTPEEIFEANGETKVAREDLQKHQYDDGEAKKAIRCEIDDYKKKLEKNEGLIAEYAKAEDVPEGEYQDAKEKDEELARQIAELQLGRDNPYSDETIALNQELAALNDKYAKAVTAPIDHTVSEGLRTKLNAKRDELSQSIRDGNSLNQRLAWLKSEIEALEKKREGFIAKIRSLQEEYKTVEVSDVCPTCGQKLPPEKIQEAVNMKKAEIAEKVESIKQEGIANKEVLTSRRNELLNMDVKDYRAEQAKLNAEVSSLETELAKALKEEDAHRVNAVDPSIQKRIGEINGRLAEIAELKAKGLADKQSEIASLKAKREECGKAFVARSVYESAQKRLRELKSENAAVGGALAGAEQRLWAVGAFIKTKLALLDKHMASKLGEVRFQLIKENIKEGSYDEVCKPYVISPVTGKHTETLFESGSKSEQIYTGVQIIKAIREARGWESLPILFDQGGELDSETTATIAIKADAQILAVRVEGTDKTPSFKPYLG